VGTANQLGFQRFLSIFVAYHLHLTINLHADFLS
jgi:hypothetical protein